VVYHLTPENRIRKDYFLAWWYAKARADIREQGTPAGARWLVAGIPLVLFRRLTMCTIRWMFAIEPARRFTNKISVWALAGAIQESYCQDISRKQQNQGANP
jgi:hypothetical protein